MKAFARLFTELDASTSVLAKVRAMVDYLRAADPRDAAWAVYFLAGGKPRQGVNAATLRALAAQRAGLPAWLFDAAYQAAGDLAETIAHVLPAPTASSDLALADWVEDRLLPLREAGASEQALRIAAYWDELDVTARVVITKLIGGGFRLGVSKLLVQRALAEVAGVDPKVVAQRMMGYTDRRQRPGAQDYLRLLGAGSPGTADEGQPYPFFLAHAWAGSVQAMTTELGSAAAWIVEWKYDGIRAQLVRRAGRVWIWSRGEELVTDVFPEVAAHAALLPDGTVLDGEIVAWRDGRPGTFDQLQRRLGRKTVTARLMSEVPAGFVAYDLLEWQGEDRRAEPQTQRRELLETALDAVPGLHLSPIEARDAWAAYAALRESSRARGVEGFMLKHRQSRYGAGRTKADGTWWKWKIEPLCVDAVLIYAQAGHGRRAGLYTDYTFAVWSRPPRDAAEAQAVVDAIERREPAQPQALQLVAFAKAYTGLTDDEIRDVDRVIRSTTLEKFGPVRSVRPTVVFELGFEAIHASARHKSGLAVRFPRMLRRRSDKPLHEAATLQDLHALLRATAPAG